MSPDDECRDQGDQNKLPLVHIFVESPRQQRKSRRHSYGAERDVTEGDGDDQEQDHKAQNGFRGEQYKSPKTGSNALAAAKLEPDGEKMAEHGEERGRGHDELLVRSGEQRTCQYNRSQTLGGVENESRNSECGRLAGHVRRANVAAAGRAHILTRENPDQQVARWDGAQQVAYGGGDEVRIHVRCCLSKLAGGEPGVPARPPQSWTGETPVSPLTVSPLTMIERE